MDSLKERYQTIIEKIFQDYIDFIGEEENIQFEIIDTPQPPSTESARLWHRLSRMVHH
ncbi:MAG: hypothetical protein RLZZ568_921 [Cyanobacteriota bacterium]